MNTEEARQDSEHAADALGHPLGASGARITGEAAQILQDEKGANYALATMCIGGGQGIATILKKPANDNLYPDDKNCWVPPPVKQRIQKGAGKPAAPKP